MKSRKKPFLKHLKSKKIVLNKYRVYIIVKYFKNNDYQQFNCSKLLTEAQLFDKISSKEMV